MPKKHQEEVLFDPKRFESPSSEQTGEVDLQEIRSAVEKDLKMLTDVTDAAKERIGLEEVAQLGASTLPNEVQIAIIEDVEDLERITDEEHERIEAIFAQPGMSRRRAEEIVLGEARAARINGETPKFHQSSSKKGHEKSSYPGQNPYKGKHRSGKHPIDISPRVRTVGDANSGNHNLR
jgi:hypothetical protein